MKKNWWKYLGALLVLYAIIIGIYRPLNPGILKISNYNVIAGGTYDFDISTYNTDFQSGDDIDAFIKINDTFGIQSSKVEVIDFNFIKATFDIPAKLPNIVNRDAYSLIISASGVGSFVRPGGIFITQKVIDLEGAIAAWPKSNFGDFKKAAKKNFPFRAILYESLRNLFYHVPMWFGMTFMLIGSLVYGVLYLIKNEMKFDIYSKCLTKVAVLYGVLGCATGSIWAKGTWGTWWTFQEIKLNVSLAALLLYFAYFLLRSAIDDEMIRAKVSSIFSIIAFVATILLLFVIPRIVTDSLHPGNGGNPGFGGEDLDSTLRTVFYPAVIGWTLLGFWIAQLSWRTELLQDYLLEKFD